MIIFGVLMIIFGKVLIGDHLRGISSHFGHQFPSVDVVVVSPTSRVRNDAQDGSEGDQKPPKVIKVIIPCAGIIFSVMPPHLARGGLR